MARSDRNEQELKEELCGYNFAFPIMPRLLQFLNQSSVFAGKRIGWHCHLTALTAMSAEVLAGSGAELYLSECNADTTDPAALDYMRKLGAEIFLGSESPLAVIEKRPQLISDTGFVLTEQYLESRSKNSATPIVAACEITSSGISKMRRLKELDFPLINLNDGQLKTVIENYHGVGDGVMDALFRLTGKLWSGRRAAVLGYGKVGAGVAEHLRRRGALLSIIENDPCRRLLAHYDGFALSTLPAALASCELIVTATGKRSSLGSAEFAACRDGIILMNVGHFPDEIDLSALQNMSRSRRQLRENLIEYELPGQDPRQSRKIYTAGGAGPANVVMLSGSPEPTLIHLAAEILSMQYALGAGTETTLVPGENPIPAEVEQQVSLLALESLGLF